MTSRLLEPPRPCRAALDPLELSALSHLSRHLIKLVQNSMQHLIQLVQVTIDDELGQLLLNIRYIMAEVDAG